MSRLEDRVEHSVPLRLISLGVVLLAAMFFSTLPQFTVGILAPRFLEELGIGETTIGLVVSLLYLSAAIVARLSGRMIDLVSGRTSIAIIFSAATTSLIIMAASQNVIYLGAAALVGGIAAGINNPVTNRVVAVHVPHGRRAPVMGAKQIGVMLAQMAAGALLPFFVLTIGWRMGLLLIAAAGLLALVAGHLTLPPDPARSSSRKAMNVVPAFVRRQVRWLQFFAATMAIAMSALSTYLALYGVTRVGMSLRAAGMVVAAMGLTAVVSRLVWAMVAERMNDAPLVLVLLSGGSVLGLFAIVGAEIAGPWLLWVGAVATGATAGSWNVVVQLTVVTEVHTNDTAAASGGVQAAFLVGLMVGAPLFGLVVELSNSYQTAWSVATVMACAGFGISMRERIRRRLHVVQGSHP